MPGLKGNQVPELPGGVPSSRHQSVHQVFYLGVMKDALSGFNLDQIETLGVKAQQLQNMLGQLQEMTAKKG